MENKKSKWRWMVNAFTCFPCYINTERGERLSFSLSKRDVVLYKIFIDVYGGPRRDKQTRHREKRITETGPGC